MMQLGIFAKTFVRDSLEANLDAVQGYGYQCVQYNMVCAGLSSMPDHIDDALCIRIRKQLAARRLSMPAISGTFNIIHPDLQQREAGFRSLQVLANSCDNLGTTVITFCTGTRDHQSMWRHHPDNDTPEAWKEMIRSMRRAVEIAQEAAVTIAFEPEVNNIVNTPEKGRRLLDEIDSPHLKVVMDGANVFHTGQLQQQHEVLDRTFQLLARDIAIAHAKDLSHDGDAGHEAAGTGLLDYDYYLRLLRDSGFDGPLITHGLEESQAEQVARFLREKLAQLDRSQ